MWIIVLIISKLFRVSQTSWDDNQNECIVLNE